MESPISPKVTIAVFAAAIVTVLVYGVNTLWGVDIPVLIQGALTTLIVGAAGWWKKDPIRAAGVAAIAAPVDTPVGALRAVVEASPQV